MYHVPQQSYPHQIYQIGYLFGVTSNDNSGSEFTSNVFGVKNVDGSKPGKGDG